MEGKPFSHQNSQTILQVTWSCFLCPEENTRERQGRAEMNEEVWSNWSFVSHKISRMLFVAVCSWSNNIYPVFKTKKCWFDEDQHKRVQEAADVKNFHIMPRQHFLSRCHFARLHADDVLLLQLEEMRLMKILCVQTCRSWLQREKCPWNMNAAEIFHRDISATRNMKCLLWASPLSDLHRWRWIDSKQKDLINRYYLQSELSKEEKKGRSYSKQWKLTSLITHYEWPLLLRQWRWKNPYSMLLVHMKLQSSGLCQLLLKSPQRILHGRDFSWSCVV